MPNYFDNQKRGWEWRVTDSKAEVTTDHGTHTHTLDLSNVTIGEMSENTGKTIGTRHMIIRQQRRPTHLIHHQKEARIWKEIHSSSR